MSKHMNSNDSGMNLNFGDYRKELVFLEKMIDDVEVHFKYDSEIKDDNVVATSEYIALLCAGALERINFLKKQLAFYN